MRKCVCRVRRLTGLGGEAGQQVLAPADHLLDDPSRQVGGGELGHAEVGAGQEPAGQCLVQPPGGQPDGVALRHGRERGASSVHHGRA